MNAVHIVQGQVSQNVRVAAVLRSGSVVTARVLSRNGDGSYSVSIAGQKISVKAETSLVPGSVFSAKVNVKGGVVQLSLVKEQAAPSELVQKMATDGKSLSPEISEFLSSLGFEPNAESLKLFQFMQQLGIKIDVPLAKKALLASKKGDPGGEKAQVALLLEEKGIAASDERVSAILGNGKRKDENGKRQKREDRNEELGVRTEELGIRSEELAVRSEQGAVDGNDSVNFVRDFFDSVDSASLTHKNGLLSAFNTVLSSPKKEIPLNHWIVLPFEWNFKDSFGTIKILFDSELKNLQKVVIDMQNAELNRIFALDFTKGGLDSVKFASSADSSHSSMGELPLLSSLFPSSVRVERADFEALSGFPCGDAALSFVQGEA